ncbi:GNAT family N-acetyltransferase [uncultured Clostridium sp.]|uniref:GNAT family N-acetyltransferase n=1 Tax=uncultured Clostridium sp. TaxID=59620 RepID=UPI0025FB68D8|nr:GNAT family N-acetyltransferase [uncultured Clostridium sp.]
MNDVLYDTRKDLPCKALHDLFFAVGWSDGEITPNMLENFNKNFINSALVFSAWANGELVGCIRVLSDQMFRSVIYDLAVHPKFQNQGIGTELVRKCREIFPNSEWLVQTKTAAAFYEKIGFNVNKEVFLSIPCKWF